MTNQSNSVPAENIESLIRTIRGQKVILDNDLSRVFGVPAKRLNEQVKRNRERFPADFMFQLNREEAEAILRSRSQIATLNRGQNIKYLPYAFTENGAIMAANVLNSPQAVRMSVFVVRAFVKMREILAGTKELARQLKALEAQLTARLDVHEAAIVDVLQRIMRLLDPPPEPEPPRRQIGFHAKPEGESGGSGKGRKR
ncbi:MAG: DNA-binding protein [Verrucomicrobia bacterium]|nr:MAG: DNA-binding protein [Verrucomicrobiota bacterium]